MYPFFEIGNARTDTVLKELLFRFRVALEHSWHAVDLPAPVRRALTCIHANLFDSQLDVTFVRVQCGLKNHNISCHFKHVIGQDMPRYIERQRLEAAKYLLRHTEEKVLEIAWSVGYANPETFTRAFRRNEGCSAVQYRDRSRRQVA